MADLAVLKIKIEVSGASTAKKNIDNLTTSTNKAKTSTNNLTSAFDRMATQSSKFKTIGRDFNRFIALPLGVAAAASVKFANDLNQGLGNVQTLIPGTVGRIDELKEAVKEIGVESGKSFDDLTSGLYRTISVFQDGEDTVDRFRTAVKAGIAGYASTADAVQLLSSVTRAYGDTSSDAVDKVANLAFTAVRLGDTTFPALASAMQVATDRAVRLGVSQEDLFTSMATLTGITGDASMVATQFRSAMDSLLTPTDTMTQLFSKLGVESGEAMIAQYGFVESLKLIYDSAAASGIALQDLITRKEGITLVSRLATEQFDDFNEKATAMTGELEELDSAFLAATTGVDKFGFALKQNKARISTASTEIGDTLLPNLVSLTGFIATLIESFNSLSSFTQNLIINFSALASAMGTVTIALGALTNAAKIFTSLQAPVTALITLLSGPVGIAVAIGAVAAAFVLAKKRADEFQEAIEISNSITEFVGSHTKNVKELADKYDSLTEEIGLNNSEAAISEKQYNDLIKVYPKLVGQIESQETALKDVYNIN